MAIAGRGGLIGMHCGVFCGRGEIIDYEIQQMVGADVAQPGGKQHWENPVFLDGFMQRWNQVFFSDGAFIEELFHQLVFAFGNNLHQLFVGFLGRGFQIGGNGAFFAFAVAAHFVGVSLHGDQIDHAFQALFTADGNLHRDHQAAKGVDQAFQRGFPVGALAVHAAHADHARQVDLVGILPDFFRHHFNAGNAIDHHQRGFSRGHGDLGFMREHGEAGRIEQIDLGVVPLHGGNGGGDGHLAGDFFFVVVGDGGAVVHAAQLGRGAARVQHGGNQGGLARVRVPNHDEIADVLAFVNLQKCLLQQAGPGQISRRIGKFYLDC